VREEGLIETEVDLRPGVRETTDQFELK